MPSRMLVACFTNCVSATAKRSPTGRQRRRAATVNVQPPRLVTSVDSATQTPPWYSRIGAGTGAAGLVADNLAVVVDVVGGGRIVPVEAEVDHGAAARTVIWHIIGRCRGDADRCQPRHQSQNQSR